MISIVGFNFPLDIFAMEHMGTYRKTVDTVEVTNGIFDKTYISSDFDAVYNPYYPTDWDISTIMSALFNGTINGGNTDYILSQLDAIRIKRRKKGDVIWTTIAEVLIQNPDEFFIETTDNTNAAYTEYEYALVPILSLENDMEGSYIIDSVMSCFDGIFICDTETMYKFYAGVAFGEGEQKNITGVYEPLGKKYPIVVSNALTNYYKSSVKGTVITYNGLENNVLDRKSEVEYRKGLLEFLTNKKAKVIKDWNGNQWLVMIVNNPRVSPNNQLGFGLADVSMEFVEIGDSSSTSDLKASGLFKTT